MAHDGKVRVLVVDNHPLVRDGLRALVDSQADLHVVGAAANAEEAARLVAEVSADIVLVEISLPGMGGVKLTEAILASTPSLRVIAVTRHTDQAFVAGMLGAGASGYVLKQSRSSELLDAIRAVAAGHRFVDPAVQGPMAPAPLPRLRK
jgi:DNA-binding NarL/FixJ family response regulator